MRGRGFFSLQVTVKAGMINVTTCSFQVLWKYSGEIQPLKLMARDAVSIGQNISTKAIGKMEREVR